MLVEMNDLKTYFNHKLDSILRNDDSLLQDLTESMRYSLFSESKRLRPLFCFLVGDLFKVSRDKLISLACALELIHTASLILDDLPYMDDAQLRRGKAANHLIYGQDTAILASIGLLMKAFEIISNDTHLTPDIKTKVLLHLTHGVGMGGMTAGQFVDLKFSSPTINPDKLDYIHKHKTASLFVLAGLLAAIVGNASDHEQRAIKDYALNLGFAFQIFDDILDLDGDPAETGKSKRRDKGNFVQLYGLETAKALAREYTEKAFRSLDKFEGRNEKLLQLGNLLLDRKR